ncbi:hypothetical protein [Streptomyces sp. NEAU-S7GS2]|uniref:hypothetical protein n=1 Tax=Streptomyces sp. NEAU-S7GS2 TaxID=2202000 RepID=UPI001EF4AF23|nr:hypothetical protein [Streptomyces sp. NEAU-S7GS2]
MCATGVPGVPCHRPGPPDHLDVRDPDPPFGPRLPPGGRRPAAARRAPGHAWAGGVVGALSAAGLPRALGAAARRLIGRASTVGSHPPHPWERAGYRTSRVARACVLENTTYPYQAAELAALRPDHPLPAVPVTVLAAYDGSEAAGRLRWLERQRGLAAELGGRFAVAAPAGHLVMADVPESVVRAVLDLSGTGHDATVADRP